MDLASRVNREGRQEGIRLVGAVDISATDSDGRARAAAVVLSYPSLETVELKVVREKPPFPYVPGLLAFRELPLILAALERVEHEPQLLLADGQGLAHPRRLGIACHLGLWLGRPVIGCAKSLLVGAHGPLGETRGSRAELWDRGELVGAAVRTWQGVTPVYVSTGHLICLEAAIEWVLSLTRSYRIPEPLRMAHLAASGMMGEVPRTTLSRRLHG
jgi:deoxyribonuclease V